MSAGPNQLVLTPQPPQYFDYRRASSDAGLAPDQLHALIVIFERDYPYDVMLRELHVLRACNSISRGGVTIQQILSAPFEERAA